jgi:hypothetical protein
MKLPAWLWPPITGRTFLDVWSLAHFAAGLLIGFDLGAQDVRFLTFAAIILALGYIWEVFEQFVLEKYTKTVKHPESPLNRWVSDPLMVFLGGLLGFWLVSYQ